MVKEFPSWVLPAAVIFGIMLIGIIAWRTLTGYDAPVGKDIAVRPGMYNMQEEMRRPRPKKPIEIVRAAQP